MDTSRRRPKYKHAHKNDRVVISLLHPIAHRFSTTLSRSRISTRMSFEDRTRKTRDAIAAQREQEDLIRARINAETNIEEITKLSRVLDAAIAERMTNENSLERMPRVAHFASAAAAAAITPPLDSRPSPAMAASSGPHHNAPQPPEHFRARWNLVDWPEKVKPTECRICGPESAFRCLHHCSACKEMYCASCLHDMNGSIRSISAMLCPACNARGFV